MSAVGTGIGYLFTCLVARRVVLNSSEVSGRKVKLFCCTMGIICSILCIFLLLTPSSPGYIAFAPRVVLAVWVLLGIFFYFMQKKVWSRYSVEEMSVNILGSAKTPVFFKK